MDHEDQIARIQRRREETWAFVGDHNRLMTEQAKLAPDTPFAPALFALGGMVVGATLLAAGMIFARVIGA